MKYPGRYRIRFRSGAVLIMTACSATEANLRFENGLVVHHRATGGVRYRTKKSCEFGWDLHDGVDIISFILFCAIPTAIFAALDWAGDYNFIVCFS